VTNIIDAIGIEKIVVTHSLTHTHTLVTFVALSLHDVIHAKENSFSCVYNRQNERKRSFLSHG